MAYLSLCRALTRKHNKINYVEKYSAALHIFPCYGRSVFEMRKLVTFALLVFALLCQSAVADDLEDFGSQMSYFYLSPSAEAFKSFQSKAEQLRGQGVRVRPYF